MIKSTNTYKSPICVYISSNCTSDDGYIPIVTDNIDYSNQYYVIGMCDKFKIIDNYYSQFKVI